MQTVFGHRYTISDSNIIDLRSDVVTRQTVGMKEAMFSAEVANDGWGEDPTVNKLQDKFAEMVGMEAALFVPSGSMGNLVAIMAQTERGDEIIADINSHIFQYSVAAVSTCAGVQIRSLSPANTFFNINEIELNIRQQGFQYPRTSMVCLENPHNINGGKIHDPLEFRKIAGYCHKNGIKVHLDGSRLFNAAVAKRCDVKAWTSYVDTVMCCLSKSLGGPMGSLVAGKKETIDRAIHYRRMLGGHMRQAGYLAAAGIFALDNNIQRLEEDHIKAGSFYDGICSIKNVEAIIPQTNMVFFRVPGKIDDFVRRLEEKGLLVSQYAQGYIRAVFHMDVTFEDIKKSILIVRDCCD